MDDPNYLIRVIVHEPEKAPLTHYVQCEIEGELKAGKIPSEDSVIEFLKKRQHYSNNTEFETKGISAMLEVELNKYPDKL